MKSSDGTSRIVYVTTVPSFEKSVFARFALPHFAHVSAVVTWECPHSEHSTPLKIPFLAASMYSPIEVVLSPPEYVNRSGPARGSHIMGEPYLRILDLPLPALPEKLLIRLDYLPDPRRSDGMTLGFEPA